MLKFYEQAHQNSPPSLRPTPSLCRFYDEEVRTRWEAPLNAKFLELGCGDLPVLSEFVPRKNLTAVDFAPTAITRAQAREQLKDVQFLKLDLTASFPPGRFDGVLDSHLLHCLTDEGARSFYLRSIANALTDEGCFAGECMVYQSQMRFEEGFEYNLERGILFDWNGPGPIRKIPTAYDFEKELLGNGLKIIYYRAHSEYKVIPHGQRSVALPTDPDLLRFICRKDRLSSDKSPHS